MVILNIFLLFAFNLAWHTIAPEIEIYNHTLQNAFSDLNCLFCSDHIIAIICIPKYPVYLQFMLLLFFSIIILNSYLLKSMQLFDQRYFIWENIGAKINQRILIGCLAIRSNSLMNELLSGNIHVVHNFCNFWYNK